MRLYYVHCILFVVHVIEDLGSLDHPQFMLRFVLYSMPKFV
jgi:hypothetical protein